MALIIIYLHVVIQRQRGWPSAHASKSTIRGTQGREPTKKLAGSPPASKSARTSTPQSSRTWPRRSQGINGAAILASEHLLPALIDHRATSAISNSRTLCVRTSMAEVYLPILKSLQIKDPNAISVSKIPSTGRLMRARWRREPQRNPAPALVQATNRLV